MLDLYVEILKLTNDRNVEMLDRGKEFMDELTQVVSKFSNLSKDVRKVVVPGPLFENEPEIQDYGVLSIMAKGSNRLKGAINVSGKHVLELKAMSDKASKSLEMGSFYRNDPFKRV
jgi:hypothetical protein